MSQPQLGNTGTDFENKTIVFNVTLFDHTLQTRLQQLGAVCILPITDIKWSTSERNQWPLPKFDILIKNPAPPTSRRLQLGATTTTTTKVKGNKRAIQLVGAAAKLTSPLDDGAERLMTIEEHFAAKAKQDHIPTWSLTKLREEVSTHDTPRADASAEEVYKEFPLLRDCGVPEEVLLSGNPYIIIQDNTGKYKTEYKEFKPTSDGRPTVPRLYYDSLPGSCPFLPPPVVSSAPVSE